MIPVIPTRRTLPRRSPFNAWLILTAFHCGLLSAGPGDYDTTFQTGTDLDGINYVAVDQGDGRILAGGGFLNAGGGNDYLGRFDASGAVDPEFNPGDLLNSEVNAIAMLGDGDILVAGFFTDAGGNDYLCRLNPDGSIDSGFNPGIVINSLVLAIAVQPDGKILAGGSFFDADGNNGVCRLEADGTIDTTFSPGNLLNNTVTSIAIQEDGKIVVAGEFINPGGSGNRYLCRLNADGSLDRSFSPGSLLSDFANAVLVDPLGRIVVGGNFTNVGGSGGMDHVCRLNPDGSLDESFDPGDLLNDRVYGLALQTNGELIVSGDFTEAGGRDWSICRLNGDGRHDRAFNPSDTLTGGCLGVFLQAGGEVLCAVDGINLPFGIGEDNYICRLLNNPAGSSLVVDGGSLVRWTREGSAPEAVWVEFELSTDSGLTYASLGNGVRVADGWELGGLDVPERGQVRALALVRGGTNCGSSGFVVETQRFGGGRPPTVVIDGAKTIRTKLSRVKLRGRAFDPDGDLRSIEFMDSRPGPSRFRSAKGLDFWTANAILRKGRNIVRVRATDSRRATSEIPRITVIRK